MADRTHRMLDITKCLNELTAHNMRQAAEEHQFVDVIRDYFCNQDSDESDESSNYDSDTEPTVPCSTMDGHSKPSADSDTLSNIEDGGMYDEPNFTIYRFY